jgi:glycosyltransferase involved in cell wall biosynthesis
MSDPVLLLSVVVPVRNEGPNIGPLIGEIETALSGVAHEIVYVDDGSEDETPHCLREMRARAPLVVRRHRASGSRRWMATGRTTRRISPPCWPRRARPGP